MSKYSYQKLAELVSTANSRHDRWRPHFQDCYDFCLPNRDDMYTTNIGEDRVSDIYDDTAVGALQDFAGMMHESYFPPFGHIIQLVPGPNVPKEQHKAAQKHLDEVTEQVHIGIHESNAHTEFADAFTDYGISTFNMSIVPDPGPTGLRFQAWPLSAVRLGNGPYGGVGFSCFHLKHSPRELKAMYPQMKLPVALHGHDRDKPIAVYDIVYRDPDKRMEEVYHRHLVNFDFGKDDSEMLYRQFSGRGSNPRIHGRFSKGTGEVYGRGPAYNTLASIKTVNLSTQLTLENADMGVGGIWKAPFDGVINPDTIQLVSGTVIPYMPGTKGLESIQSPMNIDLANFIDERYRKFILRGFYVDNFEGQGKTPISSREAQQRQVLMKQRMGRPYVRGISEILIPTIQRVLYIKKALGQIDLPQDVNGQDIQIRIVSPLARVLKSEEILRKTDAVRAVNATLGPQQAQMMLNAPLIAKDLMDLYEQPAEYIRDEAGITSQTNILQQLGGIGGAGQTPTIPGDGEIA